MEKIFLDIVRVVGGAIYTFITEYLVLTIVFLVLCSLVWLLLYCIKSEGLFSKR